MAWNPFKEIKKTAQKVFKKGKKEVQHTAKKVDPPNPIEMIKDLQGKFVQLEKKVDALVKEIPTDPLDALEKTFKAVAEKSIKTGWRVIDIAIPDLACGFTFGYITVNFEGNPRKKVALIKKWNNNLPTNVNQLEKMILELGPTSVGLQPSITIPVVDIGFSVYGLYTPKHFISKAKALYKEIMP